MRKSVLALIGVALVGAATIIQMTVDWYQSYAEGIPMPRVIQALTIVAGLLALLSVIITLLGGRHPNAAAT